MIWNGDCAVTECTREAVDDKGLCRRHRATYDAQMAPQSAPAVLMDQRGNYWRVFPKGSLPGADEDMLSMCPTSPDNYRSEPVAIYRQGRDLSAQQMQELLSSIDQATDDLLLKRAAQNAWQAWTTGRDMVTEAEVLIQMIGSRAGVKP